MAELPHVALTDALELLLLLAHEDNERRCERAAVRWASRYMREIPDVEAPEAQAVLGLVLMLGGSRRVQGATSLAQLLDRRSQLPAAEMLLREVGDSAMRARV